MNDSAQKGDDNYDFLAYASLMESKASAKPDNNLKNDSEFDKFLNAAQQEEAIRKHKFSYNAPSEEPDLS